MVVRTQMRIMEVQIYMYLCCDFLEAGLDWAWTWLGLSIRAVLLFVHVM